nr:H-NS family nucleoid-associated regulatory protein [Burkholderia latens]
MAAREILGDGRARKRQRGQAKYRDPVTGATWTDRGRPPAWIRGRNRAAFVIER